MTTQPHSIQDRLLLGDETEKKAALEEFIAKDGKKFYSFFSRRTTFKLNTPSKTTFFLEKRLPKEEIDDLLQRSLLTMLEQLKGIYKFKSHGTITLYQKLINTNQIKQVDDFQPLPYLIGIGKGILINQNKAKSKQNVSLFSYLFSFFHNHEKSEEEEMEHLEYNNYLLGTEHNFEFDLITNNIHQNCFETLSVTCKKIVNLLDEGYKLLEIAEELKMSYDSIKTTKYNCKNTYKECLYNKPK